MGAEMLGSAVLAVRLEGIYALKSLAEEHPKQYHVQVKSLLPFVRNPTWRQQRGRISITGNNSMTTENGKMYRQLLRVAIAAVAKRD